MVNVAKKSKKSKQLKPADMEALAAAAECLKTLAHPVRIRMVQLLLHAQRPSSVVLLVRSWPHLMKDWTNGCIEQL